jgi:molecular chaperone GrpE
MKFKNPFSKEKEMSQENEQAPATENNALTEELKEASQVEGSEQQPLEEDLMAKKDDEIAALKDQLLRLMADFENYKKHARKERLDLIKSASEELIKELLPAMDDFERAFKAEEQAENAKSSGGMHLIFQKIKSTLEHKGLQAMDTTGKVFDPEVHDAITNIPVEDENKKGTVIDEIEKGYYLHEKVIRYAKVVVGS